MRACEDTFWTITPCKTSDCSCLPCYGHWLTEPHISYRRGTARRDIAVFFVGFSCRRSFTLPIEDEVKRKEQILMAGRGPSTVENIDAGMKNTIVMNQALATCFANRI